MDVVNVTNDDAQPLTGKTGGKRYLNVITVGGGLPFRPDVGDIPDGLMLYAVIRHTLLPNGRDECSPALTATNTGGLIHRCYHKKSGGHDHCRRHPARLIFYKRSGCL